MSRQKVYDFKFKYNKDLSNKDKQFKSVNGHHNSCVIRDPNDVPGLEHKFNIVEYSIVFEEPDENVSGLHLWMGENEIKLFTDPHQKFFYACPFIECEFKLGQYDWHVRHEVVKNGEVTYPVYDKQSFEINVKFVKSTSSKYEIFKDMYHTKCSNDEKKNFLSNYVHYDKRVNALVPVRKGGHLFKPGGHVYKKVFDFCNDVYEELYDVTLNRMLHFVS